ncbi:hypothetical protein JMA_27080 [Jeotgalibacillus malaysiensis]|uniref:Prophage tail endopeptidase domain-containing protein n=1 Tax=Jeotgalibacillus malaysiensis TaxID=1508404 RepID=A0A0B5AP28_9BACL|nr:phage tail protein [Jeotgalibacillus malaysiensis]AJD92025.1 hypothetical protein JMA_27080 [Jeotgalibacillus malaysiensis]
MLPVTNLIGETKLLRHIKQVTRTRRVNGEKTLSFVALPDDRDEEAWGYVDTESKINFLGDEFVIKRNNEKGVGNQSIKQVDAVHSFFNVMINCFQYNLHNGSQTFAAALTRVFEPTPYTFSIVDSFNAETFENFGRENCLALFQKVLERYGSEFELIGNTVYLKRKIGADTGFQFRWKHNVKAIDKSVDTNNLATYIMGYGGQPNENGEYPITLPHEDNVELFGRLDADAVYDERITTVEGMQERLERELISEPQLSITVDITDRDLFRNEGDRGFIIYEPMKIKVNARVVEVQETFEYINKKWQVVKTAVTLSNLKEKLTDQNTRFAQTSKRLDRLFEGREPLPYNVLPEAVRIASEAINNSLTEIQYPPGQGIVLQDPNNPNRLIRLTSAGIGISDDGGQTYRTAMTGVGIVADEIATGILRANNVAIVGEDDLFFWDGTGLWAINAADNTKYVKLDSNGLYIAKGAMTIERPDGFVVMNSGILQSEFATDEHDPPFMENVSINGIWKTTTETSPANFNAYFFKHTSRYLNIRFALHDSGGGQGSRLSVYSVGGGGALLGQRTVYNVTSGQAVEETLTIDLGIPDGTEKGVYVRLNTNTGGTASGRVLKRTLSG